MSKFVPKTFFVIFPKDLYRRGNSTWHKLDYVRTINSGKSSVDIDTYYVDGDEYVKANNSGVSLFGEDPGSGHIYLIKQGTLLGNDLKIYQDKINHYMIVPQQDMPLLKFLGCLQELSRKCEKVR